MAAFTATTFKARSSPAFDAVDDADVDIALDIAESYVSETDWGDSRYHHGVYFLAAHWLTAEEMLKAGNGSGVSGGVGSVPAGAVTSEKIKSWSASYASPSASKMTLEEMSLSVTAWGRQFLALRQLVFARRTI